MSQDEEIESRIDAEAWDRQIEADSAAGRLDGLLEESMAEHKAGQSRGLSDTKRRQMLDDMTREAHELGLNWD